MAGPRPLRAVQGPRQRRARARCWRRRASSTTRCSTASTDSNRRSACTRTSRSPGVEMCTGALGHGLAVAMGMALGARIQKQDFHTFVMLGDGELHEGSNWEAAMAAAHYRLANLTAIVDFNKISPERPRRRHHRHRAAGRQVARLRLGGARDRRPRHGRGGRRARRAAARSATGPPALIAHTVKGKGVSFAENTYLWHSNTVNDEIYARRWRSWASHEHRRCTRRTGAPAPPTRPASPSARRCSSSARASRARSCCPPTRRTCSASARTSSAIATASSRSASPSRTRSASPPAWRPPACAPTCAPTRRSSPRAAWSRCATTSPTRTSAS